MQQRSGDMSGRTEADEAASAAGFRLGVVMLATSFPRLEGDIGNPETFPFPVLYRRVEQAQVARVVTAGETAPEVTEAILEAARALEAQGASFVATSCGFLGGLQARLQAALSVPVIASSLLLLPLLRALYGPARPIGVLTFDSTHLSPHHFGDLGNWALGDWDLEGAVEIEGLESGTELHRVITRDLADLDRPLAEQDAVAAARRLVGRCPAVPAILLECTNLSPYRAEIALAIRRPVYVLNQAILWHAQAAGNCL
jgi:hypothetical protein